MRKIILIRFTPDDAKEEFKENLRYKYWANRTSKKYKSDPKIVFSINKKDRRSLYLLMRSGVNLITLTNMLVSSCDASRNFALDIFKQNTVKLGKYLSKMLLLGTYVQITDYENIIPKKVIRRIKNIQKPN